MKAGAVMLVLSAAALMPLTACPQRTPPVLRIAAAADLEPVLPGVLAQFEKQTGVRAEATYQSSAMLAQQILNGAPDDIFFSADRSFAAQVVRGNMALEPQPVTYAEGTLVLWARNGEPLLQGRPVSLELLRNPALQSLAIANPGHAPYGRAAQQAIESMKLTGALAPRLRIAANIEQAAQYAESGNAQAGFLSLTSALTPRLRAEGTYVVVPRSLYAPLVQAAVVMRHSADQQDAVRLLEFMKTPAVLRYLADKGLAAPR